MTKFIPRIALVLAIAGFGMLSCEKKKGRQGAPTVHYSLGLNSDGISYSLPVSDLKEGSVSVEGHGTRLDATGMIPCGRYFYFFSRGEKKFYQYELNTDGTIAKRRDLAVGKYIADWAYSQNLVNDSTILIMDPEKWGEPAVKWFTIKIPDMLISGSGRLELPTKRQKTGTNWKSNVGNGVVHAGKFIMGTVYYDFEGNFAPGSHVVAFDFPGMTNPKLVSTYQTDAELGIYSNNNFVKTANGDLYIAASRGALVGSKTDSKVYGGILRIKDGETAFDQSYFLDLTKALGSPANIIQLDDLDGTLAMAILFDDRKVKGWGDIAGDHYFFAKIDLESRTVLKYNVPKSDAHSAKRPLIEGGKYFTFLKSTLDKTTHVLEINIGGKADAYTKGLLIKGRNVKGYSITKHPGSL